MIFSRVPVLLPARWRCRAVSCPVRAEPVMTEDGYYRESWFVETFLELPDDFEAARKNGKRFAVMWELKGCPYCKETHFVNFARPDISRFVQDHFEICLLYTSPSPRD